MRARLAIPIAAGAVLAALIVNVAPVGAAPKGQRLLSGHVTTHGRQAVVKIYAWPSTEALAAVPVGGTVTPRLVSTTTAGNGAAFTASGDPAGLSAEYRDRFGSVNFEAVIDDGTSQAHWSFPAASGSTGPAVGFNLTTARVDDGTPASSRVNARPNTARATASVSTTAGQALAVSPSAAAACVPVWSKLSNSQIDEEYFTQANGSLYGPVTTHEEYTANHTLGIAFQGGGTNWSASGTANMTVNTGSTVTTNAIIESHWYANHVVYREWVTSCPGIQHEWRPDKPDTLLDRYQIVAHPTYTHCGYLNAGYSWSKAGGTSATYSAGVTLSVLSVSASSTWGSDTQQSGTANGHRIAYCGNDAGTATSTLVETHTG